MLRWYSQILTGLNWDLHNLSRVTSCPSIDDDDALDVAKSVLYVAYNQRLQVVQYTRGLRSVHSMMQGAMAVNVDMNLGAPSDMLAVGDASWGNPIQGPFKTRDLYGLIVTRTGASVYTTTKNLGLVCDSSSGAEAIPSGKASEILEYGRAIETGLGVPPTTPTVILTDNRANALVGSGLGTLRSRHAIRRYVSMLQRVSNGTCILKFVPDVQNPADCLTKPVPNDKYKASLRWMQGRADKNA